MITETEAAHALKYLIAAGALNAVEDQHIVWADYINHESPDTETRDLLPAARLCLKRWAQNQRQWKVDLPRYTQAVRAVRSQRIADAIGDKPLTPDLDLDGERYLEWIRTARAGIAQGLSRGEAEKKANDHVTANDHAIDFPRHSNENRL